ncbi:MAG: hypothetical protein U9Q22_08170 [Candidatus Altiarchaeota archaeon]|nr:hypothetical protein [Candidatus Altiarchaeota archaeon]
MEVGSTGDGGLNFWDVVMFSLKLMLKRRGILYFFIPFLVFSALTLLVLSDPESIQPSTLLIALISWMLSSYASMCVYAASFMEFREKEWTASDIMSRCMSRFLGFLAVLLLAGLIILSPLIIAVISGLFIHYIVGLIMAIPAIPLIAYLSIRFSVSEAAYVVEGKGVVEAIRRSLYLTKNKFWYVFLRLFAFGLLTGIILIPSMLIPLYQADLPHSHPSSILLSLLRDLVTCYYQTAMACFSFLIFTSLVFMKIKPGVEGPFEPEGDIIH